LVWQAELPGDFGVRSHLVSVLSPEERARLERLRLAEDQQRFITGRGLLRILIGACLQLPPERVALDITPFGKPQLVRPAGTQPLNFSVSHSGKQLLLAFHPVHEVGVDVEEVRPLTDSKAIARQTFPGRDLEALMLLDANARLDAFFRIWTRHEARLKALGRGFIDQSDAALDDQLVCSDLELPAGYQGALAWLPAVKS
jgi:4'-phosphopantetheinyl transferase